MQAAPGHANTHTHTKDTHTRAYKHRQTKRTHTHTHTHTLCDLAGVSLENGEAQVLHIILGTAKTDVRASY